MAKQFIIDNTVVPQIDGMSYDGEYFEVLFLSSDEWRELSNNHPELIEFWHGTDLADIVRAAKDDETISEAVDAFVSVCTDAVGISEGEDFCNEVGYDDLWQAIHDELMKLAE